MIYGAVTRRQRILAYLADHPDLTAGEIARALGLYPPLNPLLRSMEAKAQITATKVWWPQQGRQVNVWRIAPGGTVPPQLASEVAAHRRELGRLNQQRGRGRARGLVIPPGGAVPDLRVPSGGFTLPRGAACAGADPDLFFPEPGQDDTGARAICARCPIRRECGRPGYRDRPAIRHLGRNQLRSNRSSQTGESIMTKPEAEARPGELPGPARLARPRLSPEIEPGPRVPTTADLDAATDATAAAIADPAVTRADVERLAEAEAALYAACPDDVVAEYEAEREAEL